MAKKKKIAPTQAFIWIILLMGSAALLQNVYVLMGIIVSIPIIILYKEQSSKRRKLQKLAIEELRRMNPYEFEEYIRDLLLKSGYKRATCTPRSGDEGRDIDAIDAQGRYVQVECKRYGEKNVVGRPKIQILHSSMLDKRADRGLFVTTSRFSKEATDYAQRNNIKLIDAAKLMQIIERLPT